jgi:PKD domain-containing protein
MRTRTCALAPAAIVVALVLCEPAAAETFCVKDPACSGTSEPTIAAAIAAADGNGTGLDRVQVGPGLYAEGALLADGSNPVEIDGAGQGQTFVTRAGAVSGNKVLETQHADSIVSDLVVQIPAVSNITGLALGPATADRVGVTGGPAATGSTGITVSGGHLRRSFVSLPTEIFPGTTAIRALNGATVESTGASAGFAVSAGGSGVLLRGVRITAHEGLLISNSGADSTLTMENSQMRLLAGGPLGTVGLYARADTPDDSKLTVNMRHLTIMGPTGTGVGLQAIASSGSNATEVDVDARDSVIADLDTDLLLTESNGDTATMSIDNSFYGFAKKSVSPTASLIEGTHSLNSATVDPRFVDDRGDTHLRYDSPLIDRGVPGGLLPDESTTDLAGEPRLVDGDGDGDARRDMGAFEYQRRPPVVEAGVSPASARRGVPFSFSATATDPDPGDSIVSFGWAFDEGASAAGGAVQHAFSTLGAHSGTATATDSVGLSGTRTAGVSVVDLAAPALVIKGGSVRLTKQGVAAVTLTCPAAEESGPCDGTLALRTARKVPLHASAMRRRVRLGKAAFSVTPGRARKVRVRLSKRNRRLVARLLRVKIKATAQVHDQAGNTARVSRKLTLLPPKRKRR